MVIPEAYVEAILPLWLMMVVFFLASAGYIYRAARMQFAYVPPLAYKATSAVVFGGIGIVYFLLCISRAELFGINIELSLAMSVFRSLLLLEGLNVLALHLYVLYLRRQADLNWEKLLRE